MRLRLTSAICAALLCTSANAATFDTFTQTSTNYSAVRGGFSSFDKSLGILTGVLFTVDSRTQYYLNGYAANGPVDTTVFYTIRDTLSLNFFDYKNGAYGNGPINVALALQGAGSFAVQGQYGSTNAYATGRNTFSLDTAFFNTDYDPTSRFDISIRSSARGFYSGEGITFTAPNGVVGRQAYCSGGDEACNVHRYTLVYQYDPFPSVPEPSTWAMLILGFGVVGGAMRRRSAAGPSRTKSTYA